MHLNTFINLEENVGGYGLSRRKPTGHATISMPGVIRVYVQGLKPLKGQSYICYVMSRKADKAIRLGAITDPSKGKQSLWRININNVENSGVSAEDIDCIAVVVEGKTIGYTDIVVVGYVKQKYMIAPLLQRVLPVQEEEKPVIDKLTVNQQEDQPSPVQINKEDSLEIEQTKEVENKSEATVIIAKDVEETFHEEAVTGTEEGDKKVSKEVEVAIKEAIEKVSGDIEVKAKEEEASVEQNIEEIMAQIQIEQENVQEKSEVKSEEANEESDINLLQQQSKEEMEKIAEQVSIARQEKEKAEEMIEKSLQNLMNVIKSESNEQAKVKEDKGTLSRDLIIDKKNNIEKQIESILMRLVSEPKDEVKETEEAIEESESEYLEQLQRKLKGIKDSLEKESEQIAQNKKNRIAEETLEQESEEVDEEDIKATIQYNEEKNCFEVVDEVDVEEIDENEQMDKETGELEEESQQDTRQEVKEEVLVESKVEEVVEEDPIEEYFKEERNDVGDKFARIRDIFNTSTPIMPFEETEDIDWVRISLQELVSIPNVNYEWATQPFITFGYHKHKHLILGKNRGIEQYYVGVPDEYDDLTRDLLGADKIERFKCARNVNPAKDKAGYWIAMI